MKELDKILESFSKELIGSPLFSIMIVDEKMNILWHNRQFAQDMKGNDTEDLTGKKCFQITAQGKIHKGCPTQITLQDGKSTRGLYDFGEKNGLIMTIPLPNKLAAKIFTTIPKEAKGEVEEIVAE